MIRHLLLDLDNTLYPASGGMNEGITNRMMNFIASFLDVPLETAIKIRKQALPKYGTSLEWLKEEHNLTDEQTYFDTVHPPSELEELQKDPQLREFLLSLNLPLTLLTNAPTSHAIRVLDFFNIRDIFSGVYDLNYHNGVGKPHPQTFKTTLKAAGYTVEETLFVDDHPKYVRGYKAIGGKAVIVDEKGTFKDMAKSEGFGHIRTIYELKAVLANY